MKILLVPVFLLLASCAGVKEVTPKESKGLYSYSDVSGSYAYSRETKIVKNKLVTRYQLLDKKTNKILEKGVTASQIGTVKVGKSRVLTVRPLAAEYSVWLEGKLHQSRMQLNPKSQAMTVRLASGVQDVNFPKGAYFCYFSQIPDCLYHNHFLQKASRVRDNDEGLNFYVVWESWPYIQEQVTGVGKKLFSSASVKFEGEVNKKLRYMVELEGQVIAYEFTKSYDLVKIAWVAQGISLVPPGEEVTHEEQ